MKNQKIYSLTLSALLCAIAVLIPLISPFRIIIEPASFTLASHVAVIIAMFISPQIGSIVSIGATLGFFFAGFPIVVVARAASHLIFVIVGAYIFQHKPNILHAPKTCIPYVSVLSLLHALCEVAIVIPFYGFHNNFIYSIFILVGIGTIIHSMIDFFIAIYVYKLLPLKKNL
ncbi:MAG: hypothetical protein ACK5KR_02175 [Breznakia sp.]